MNETLYKKASTGKIQYWRIFTEANVIVTQYGQVGGKEQETRDIVTEGKNAGRSNERTPVQQAATEATARFQKTLKKGYVKNIETAQAGEVDEIIQGGISPMLAQKFSQHGDKIVYPAYISPKLDGIRCIATVKDGVATLWSRTRKPIFSLPHVVSALEKTFPDQDLTLDGELYHNDYKDNFNEIISLVRPDEPAKGHEIVQFHVFDIVSPEVFADRYGRLREAELALPLVLVPQGLVTSEEDAMVQSAAFLEQGYEGGMVKNLQSPYEHKRSYHIQKIKFMSDREFKIVGVDEGRGKLAGHVGSFICKTDDGVRFNAKLKGELSELRRLFENPSEWQEQWLTVRFQNMTPDGAPRFPVGVAIRNYE